MDKEVFWLIEGPTLSIKVYSAFLKCMSILLLNMLTLLAPTQSSDNMFHSFTVLYENENFLIYNLHYCFANANSCPMVLLSSLAEKTNIYVDIFVTIR